MKEANLVKKLKTVVTSWFKSSAKMKDGTTEKETIVRCIGDILLILSDSTGVMGVAPEEDSKNDHAT